MHSSRGVLGRLRNHREIYLVECTYWYKEEFSLWISFLIDHCPNFEIGFQKCVLGRVKTPLYDPQLFGLPFSIFFIYSDFEKKKKVAQSNSCWFKQIRYFCLF